MHHLEFIKRAAKIAHLPEPKNEYGLAGLFGSFRPSGEGVDAVFEGVENGDLVLERVLRMYEDTADSYIEGQVYFIPKASQALTVMEATAKIKSYLRSMHPIALKEASEELIPILDAAVPMHVSTTTELKEDEPADDEEYPRAWLFDIVGDYVRHGTIIPEIADLDEAFYTIAAEWALTGYLTWPAHEDYGTEPDPFEAFYDVWSSGIVVNFRTPNECLFFINR